MTTLDHVALNVTSLDRTADFYCSLLGLVRLNRVDMGDHTIQYLTSGTEVLFELIEYAEGVEPAWSGTRQQAAPRHLAWRVADVAALEPDVSRLGGVVVTKPGYVPNLDFNNMLIRDPDGIEVELVERAPTHRLG